MARRLANFINRNFMAAYEEDPRDFPFLGRWREHRHTEPPEPQRVILPTSGTAGNGKAILDWDQAALQLTRESPGWGLTLGAGATVTYAFRATAPAIMPIDTAGFSQFNAAQIAAAESALALWADAANITFVRVASGGYSNSATILFGNYAIGAAGASAFAFFPGSTAAGSVAGDVWVNISLPDNQNLTPGSFGPHILAHEIGHAIGLSHPSNYDASDPTAPTYEVNASYWQDSRAFTVMSYFGSPFVGGNLPEFSPGPQFHDIAAAQRLYGPNMATRTGDTIYGFNSNTGREHFTLTSGAVGATFAIWDAGGADTLDLSGYNENADIDLRPGSHSSAGPANPGTGPAVYNISIAVGVIIENAIGGAGADTLTGNAAANTLTGGAGVDALIGGLGDDTYIMADADTITEAGGGGTDNVQASIDYTLADEVENLILLGAAISGTGNALANTMTGNANANFLSGGLGADTLIGGTGNDVYVLDDADAITELVGGGTDLVQSSLAHHTLAANVENLTLTGVAAINGTGNTLANVITGNSGANQLSGDDGADTLIGGSGDDVLNGGSGVDTMVGGAGNDTYAVLDVGDVVTENAGEGTDAVQSLISYTLGSDVENLLLIDVVSINGTGNALANTITGSLGANTLSGLDGNDILDGYAGDDTLSGGLGADTLIGGAGNDVLTGGAGADALNGGASVGDTADYSASSSGVSVNLALGTGVGGDAQSDTLTEIENLRGSAHADTLTGNAGANTLLGSGGADSLSGLDGDDTLIGGAGADALAGGAGIDTVDYSSAGAGVSVNLQTNVATGGDAAGDTFVSVEDLTGSAFNDVLTGRDLFANVLNGGDGDDVLSGGTGGADVMHGGAGIDTLDYSLSPNGVDVRLFSGAASGGSANGDTYTSIENIIGSATKTDTLAGDAGANSIWGGGGNETITGREASDTLHGEAGNDTLLGGADSDTLIGGIGADTLGGGSQDDLVDYSASNAGVTVNLQTGSGVGGHAQGDVLVSIEDVTGSDFDDVIVGKNNVWDNVFDGRGGNDTYTGGLGNDVFVFRASSGADTVTDFSAAALSNNDAVQLLGHGAAFDTFAEVIAAASQVGAHVVLDFGSGQTLTLQNTTLASLTSNDFIFG